MGVELQDPMHILQGSLVIPLVNLALHRLQIGLANGVRGWGSCSRRGSNRAEGVNGGDRDRSRGGRERQGKKRRGFGGQ